MKQLHAAAILGLLRANDRLVVFPVEDSDEDSLKGLVPPGTVPPYVAVHVSGGPQVGETLDRSSSRMVTYAVCHCAGLTQTAARVVADEVMATLLDRRPTIEGRTCWPIRWDADRAPGVDETVTPPVWSAVDVYRLESIPGPG